MVYQETEQHKQRAEEILNSFERGMNRLIGAVNNDVTLYMAQELVNSHVREMEAIGYRMKDRYEIPRVRCIGGLLHIVPIEFEYDAPRVYVVENGLEGG